MQKSLTAMCKFLVRHLTKLLHIIVNVNSVGLFTSRKGFFLLHGFAQTALLKSEVKLTGAILDGIFGLRLLERTYAFSITYVLKCS